MSAGSASGRGTPISRLRYLECPYQHSAFHSGNILSTGSNSTLPLRALNSYPSAPSSCVYGPRPAFCSQLSSTRLRSAYDGLESRRAQRSGGRYRTPVAQRTSRCVSRSASQPLATRPSIVSHIEPGKEFARLAIVKGVRDWLDPLDRRHAARPSTAGSSTRSERPGCAGSAR